MKQGKGAVPKKEKKEYEPTKNLDILLFLRQGYTWEKTTLSTNERGWMLADVTLTKDGQVKKFVGINAMDTPAGRKALHDIAVAEKEVPIVKKSKLSTAAIKAAHKKHLREKSFEATKHHHGTGAGSTGQSSAEKARLGSGVTKKDNK
jgi:hypothetical protein